MVELDNESMIEDVNTLRQMVLEKRESLLADNQGISSRTGLSLNQSQRRSRQCFFVFINCLFPKQAVSIIGLHQSRLNQSVLMLFLE